MNKRAVVIYLLMHQPYRINPYTIFDIGKRHNYFDNSSSFDDRTNNEAVLRKVADKSYYPTLKLFEELSIKHPDFKISLSISGTLLEQLEQWRPDIIALIRRLVNSGACELVGENYYHSLAFLYSRQEFENQVAMHKRRMEEVFNYSPTAFRNTEMIFNNDLAYWADKAGYKVILSEGWDKVLGWRSPNFVYRPKYTNNIRLLMKNYRLSDDIAFRFADRSWSEWPLDSAKYVSWLNAKADEPLINLFMDFETFGEHQWADSGIFDFMKALPNEWLKDSNHTFMTVTEAASAFESVDEIDTPFTTTWADTERDLTAWLGNSMQNNAVESIYLLEDQVKNTKDQALIKDWQELLTSDHFYYMCTKWARDGDVHAYFSPYSSPYEAFINYMNTYHDLIYRLQEKGLTING